MTDRNLMRQALDALENSVDLVREDAYQAEKLYGNYPTRQGKVNGLKVLADNHEKAITALTERLAQPEQEPVAWMFQHDETGRMNYVSNDGIHNPAMFLKMNPRYALVCPLYTAPPQRKPLSDEWIHRTTVLLGFNPEWTTEIGIAHAIVRAAEAAHNIKENT